MKELTRQEVALQFAAATYTGCSTAIQIMQTEDRDKANEMGLKLDAFLPRIMSLAFDTADAFLAESARQSSTPTEPVEHPNDY